MSEQISSSNTVVTTTSQGYSALVRLIAYGTMSGIVVHLVDASLWLSAAVALVVMVTLIGAELLLAMRSVRRRPVKHNPVMSAIVERIGALSEVQLEQLVGRGAQYQAVMDGLQHDVGLEPHEREVIGPGMLAAAAHFSSVAELLSLIGKCPDCGEENDV